MAFKYLGRILTTSDNNWPAVVANLRKARRDWTRLFRILRQEGAYPWTSGTFYKVMVQATLLFGA